MRRQLLLFTTTYPYGTGETFIESEVDAVSKVFDRVTLIPMIGHGPQRAVPQNVSVQAPLWGSAASRREFYCKHALMPRTLELVARETWRAWTAYRRAHPAVFYRIWLWAMYRAALERSESVLDAIANPKVVVAYSFWAHTPALAVPTLAGAGIPVAVRYHSVDLYLDGMSTAGWIHRNCRYFPWREEIEAGSKASLFISNQGAAYFARNWPNADVSAKIVARLGAPKPELDQRPDQRHRLAGDASLVVVSCSSIVPLKRVAMIAKFVCSLAMNRSVSWHHFGAGDATGVRAVLSAKPSTLSANLHGQVENADVLAFYKASEPDLFVNFSTREGIPVSVMEAMSWGIPVLATAVGGTPEAVVPGESGLLVDVDDCNQPDALAARVLEALKPGGALASSQPRQLWQQRFNAATNAAKVANILAELDNRLDKGEVPK